MTRLLRLLAGVAMVGMLALLVTACADENGSVAAGDDEAVRKVNITGEGRVALEPDLVMMLLGVDIGRPTLTAAQSEAAETMDAVMAALHDAGVVEADIQTSTYSISLERDYTRSGSPVTGYRVYHLVTVKSRDVDGAGATLQAAIDAGANNVQSVWFALEDTTAATRQARELAVTDAREKAGELAQLADAELGDVLTISEGVSVPSAPEYRGSDSGSDTPSPAAPITPGLTEVTVTVSMVWELD